MNKLEQFDESKLLLNPFTYTLVLPVTEVISNNKYKRDIEEGLIVNDNFYIERTSSIKIYKCDSCKSFIYNLSDRAQRLYLYILYNLKHNKDWIQINEEDYMNKNSIKSINTYKTALKELLRYNFIQYTEYKTVFWINPNLFFNGNRLKKYPKNINVLEVWEQ